MSVSHTKRICQIIKLKLECADEYKKRHGNVWPGILNGVNALRRHHIVDYSIEPLPAYTGSDFEKDMKAIGDEEETQRWWRLTDGMQESFNDGASGSGKEIPWFFRFEGGSSA
ncbi:rhamnose mutarotase [Suillus subluteus]|nr:rhamnose mutarotase [Suillus subluteus]